VSEKADSIQAPSPSAVKTGIDCGVARYPFPVETGIDRAFAQMEISSGRVNLDSIGQTDILNQIWKENAIKYEEH
jgi:hypothetical protein